MCQICSMNMKRQLAIIVCAFFCAICFADVVSKESALTVAYNFVQNDTPICTSLKSAGPGSSSVFEIFPSDAPTPYHQPGCYVVNFNAGGYAIIAADDIARPVLAYSRSGHFDMNRISDGEKEWLESTANIIYHASISSVRPSDKTKNEWKSYLAGKSLQQSDEVVLETAAWGQWAPYNNMIPKVLGEVCPAGCVNTAGAIIMRYFKHPKSGKGTIPGYNWYDAKFPDNTLGHEYDWDSMPLKYEVGKYSDYQAGQVSRLVYDLGTSIKTEYKKDGASGSIYTLKNSLTNYFDYDPNIQYMERWMLKQTNANEVWESIIRNEVDNARPVLMRGTCSQKNYSGHAYVVCGYQGEYFCINWGWEESEWFGLITPVDGNFAQLAEFLEDQCIVYNIRPNEGGVGGVNYLYASSVYCSTWHYQKNLPFHLHILSSHVAIGNVPEVETTYALVDKNHHIKEIIKMQSEKIDDCMITVDFCETDELVLCYRVKGESEWIVADQTEYGSVKMHPEKPLKDDVTITIQKDRWGDKIFVFDVPQNAAIKFVCNDDDRELGDLIFDRASYGNTYYWRDWGGNNGRLMKAFRGMPGEEWTATIYNIKDSYSFVLKF